MKMRISSKSASILKLILLQNWFYVGNSSVRCITACCWSVIRVYVVYGILKKPYALYGVLSTMLANQWIFLAE